MKDADTINNFLLKKRVQRFNVNNIILFSQKSFPAWSNMASDKDSNLRCGIKKDYKNSVDQQEAQKESILSLNYLD